MQQTSLVRLLAQDQTELSVLNPAITHGASRCGWITLPNGNTATVKASVSFSDDGKSSPIPPAALNVSGVIEITRKNARRLNRIFYRLKAGGHNAA